MPQPRQPFLHDLTSQVAAPTQVWSAADGEIDPRHGGHGILHADVRMLSALQLRLDDGRRPEHIHTDRDHADGTSTDTGSDEVRFTYLLRGLSNTPTPDPVLRLDRVRRIRPGEVSERLTVSSVASEPCAVTLELAFGADLVPVEAVKVGRRGEPRPLTASSDGGSWSDGSTGGVTARLRLEPTAVPTAVSADEVGLDVRWRLTVPAHDEVTVGWRLALTDTGGAVVAGPPGPSVDGLVERALSLAGTAADCRPAVAALDGAGDE